MHGNGYLLWMGMGSEHMLGTAFLCIHFWFWTMPWPFKILSDFKKILKPTALKIDQEKMKREDSYLTFADLKNRLDKM